EIGANTETDKQFIYNLYDKILDGVKPIANMTLTEAYEEWAKDKFVHQPATMKLLIVVDKLLTGFDAPACTYLYIDKNMQDHSLFQAICRVNRIDSEDKQYGYIVDYKKLFDEVQGAIEIYTEELDYDQFGKEDCEILIQDRLTKSKERLDNAREELVLLCEPVESPHGDLEFIRYFCGNPEIPEELKIRETHRTALYKAIVSLIRAYANIADDMEGIGYNYRETGEIKNEVDHYFKLREVIRRASGETLDMKPYEADMRHLIDNYIQAEESKKVIDFGDLTMLDIISKIGIEGALGALPEGIRKNKEAVSETIENNVRRKIIKDHLIDPAYFEEMSKVLDEIIKERRSGALSYEEHLKKIVDLANDVNRGHDENLPNILKTAAQRVLYNNLNSNEDLAIAIHEAVRNNKKADWRGNRQKEQEIKAAMYKVMDDKAEVERIFEIIMEQPEY
ncbi:MAG: type I restriction endonuclease subunit R, partial [Bacteroidetes bacterium]|nr:type I restriction endonuclease subunit R [Bacteroidota bacterium]